MGRYEEQRNFLKSNFSEFKKIKTDKMKGLPQPPIVKPYNSSSNIINLPRVSENTIKNEKIYKCIKERRSINFYLCLS